ncbi:fatty acid desaturase family protein, partial [Vibrio parahaemolyticus V-223/04]
HWFTTCRNTTKHAKSCSEKKLQA